MPKTCSLYWPPGYVTSNWTAGNTTINLPTNFPTHRMNLYVNDEGIEALTLNIPRWSPRRHVEIELHPVRTQNTTRSTKVAVDGVNVWDAVPFPSYNTWRYVIFTYDPVTETWQCDAPTTFRRAICFTDGVKADWPTNWPATVEAWMTLHQEWATP